MRPPQLNSVDHPHIKTTNMLFGFKTLVVQFSVFVLALAVPVCSQAQAWLIDRLLEVQPGQTISLLDKNRQVIQTVPREWLERLDRVSQDIALTFEMIPPEIFLINSDSPNAFALPTGRPQVGVTIAMLRLIGGRDDYSATIIGHEIGHLYAKHGENKVWMSKVSQAVAQLLGIAIDATQAAKGVDTQGAGQKLGATGSSLLIAKYSRDNEREADDLGIKHMAQAGYDPEMSAAFFVYFNSTVPAHAESWLDTHPGNDERIDSMRKAAVPLRDIYLASRKPVEPSAISADADKVAAIVPDWIQLRNSALFTLWLIAQPDRVSNLLDSPRPEDSASVARLYVSAMPAFVETVYSRGDYSVAIEGLEYLANKGNKDAQRHLGEIFGKGLGGVKADAQRATYWSAMATR